MREILWFLLKPTKTTESLISKENNYKFIIIWVLLFLYSLSSLWYVYILNTKEVFWELYYIKLFLYNILYSLVFVSVVLIFWKIFWWKAKYLDVLLVTLLAKSIFILVNILSSIIINWPFINDILSESARTAWIAWVFMVWGLILVIKIFIYCWFLIIWSIWLSIIEKFSYIKAIFTIILSMVIYYFLNSFLSWINWLSVF